jgi:hypothetical protein
VAGGIFLGLAHIDDHRFFAVDALHGVGRSQAASARTLEGRHHQQCAGTNGQQEQIPVLDEKLHVNPRDSKPRNSGSSPACPAHGLDCCQGRSGRPKIVVFRRSAHFFVCAREAPRDPMYKLVLIRHGESTWNLKTASPAGPMWT